MVLAAADVSHRRKSSIIATGQLAMAHLCALISPIITDMADRQVNGQNVELMRLNLHTYSDLVPRMVVRSRLEFVSVVLVGNKEAILATYLV